MRKDFEFKIGEFYIENSANLNSFSINAIKETLINEYKNQEKDLIIKVKGTINEQETILNNSSKSEISLLINEPQILSFNDLGLRVPYFADPIDFPGDGDNPREIEYPWEVYNNNPDRGDIRAMEIVLIDANDENKEYLRYERALPGEMFIRNSEVIEKLNSVENLIYDENSSITVKAKIRLLASEDSELKDSEYIVTSNTRSYNYREK